MVIVHLLSRHAANSCITRSSSRNSASQNLRMPCIQNYRAIWNFKHNRTFLELCSSDRNSNWQTAITLDKKRGGIDMYFRLLTYFSVAIYYYSVYDLWLTIVEVFVILFTHYTRIINIIIIIMILSNKFFIVKQHFSYCNIIIILFRCISYIKYICYIHHEIIINLSYILITINH